MFRLSFRKIWAVAWSEYMKWVCNARMILVLMLFVFAMTSVVSYLTVVFLGCTLPAMSQSFVYNGWSQVVTDYDMLHPQEAGSFVSELIPKNLYNQMTPYKSVGLTFGFLIGYMMILVLIMMLFTICKKKILGFTLCGFVIAMGVAGCAIKGGWMWIFPMAHSITWLHYTDYFRELIMPISYSAIYFGGFVVLLIVLCLVAIKKINFDTVEELD